MIDYTICEEAERILLGYLLLKPDEINLCLDLTEEDFSTHGQRFKLIRDEYLKTGGLVLSHLSNIFAQNGFDKSEPAILAGEYIGGTNLSNILDVIKGYSTRRKIIETAQDAIRVASDLTCAPVDALGVLSRSTGNLAPINAIRSQASILQEIYDNGAMGKFWSTGLFGLDRRMGGGLYQGKVYGFSGRAKSGKTLLASTVSYNLKDCKQLYVAMEMGAAQIAQRLFARQGGFNSLAFLDGSKKVTGLKPDHDTHYLDAAGITWSELQTHLTSAVIKLGIQGIFIDYWQLVMGQNPRETEEKHLRTVAQGLADFAKKHNVWIFLLSQTNEDGKTFAGQGLIKACDQLYYIETPKGQEDYRFLKMAASRYTPHSDYGDEVAPSLVLNKQIGPYFEEC